MTKKDQTPVASQKKQLADLKTGDERRFSVEKFWEKLSDHATAAGAEVVEAALKLFYALQDSDTPASAKAVIVGALAYFILPTDAVFDFLPGGYVDDWGALAAALWTVAESIKDEHVNKAREKVRAWFKLDESGN